MTCNGYSCQLHVPEQVKQEICNLRFDLLNVLLRAHSWLNWDCNLRNEMMVY